MADGNFPGPRSAQFNQELGNQLLQLASSLFTNPVNQLNRIGGSADEEIPAYDPELTWDQVFRNAGYGDTASQALGLGAGIAEPGPGDAGKLIEVLGLLGPMVRLSRRGVTGPHAPTAEASGTVPVDRVAQFPGKAGEEAQIYQTGNPMDDPRTAELAEHLRQTGGQDMQPVEISVYPQDLGGGARIGEGNHRVAAWNALGMGDIPARVTYHGGAENEINAELLDQITELARELAGQGR